MLRTFAAAAASLMLAQPALSQAFTVTGGLELEFTTGNGNDSQALNGYVEAEASGFYFGIWGSAVDDSSANEVDLYVGYRGEAGKLSYDVNYTRYYFPNAGGDCCGEFFLGLGYAVTDSFAIGTELYYDPDNETGSAYLLGEYAFKDKFAVAGQYGFYDEGAGQFNEWELGVSYALSDETAVALTYHDGEDYKPYVTLGLTWDFTLFPR